MKFVEIYVLQDDGSQKVIATCKLVNDSVVCDGDGNFVRNLNVEGVFDYSMSKKQTLFPKDGIHFLEQLKFNFQSGYINASDIKET